MAEQHADNETEEEEEKGVVAPGEGGGVEELTREEEAVKPPIVLSGRNGRSLHQLDLAYSNHTHFRHSGGCPNHMSPSHDAEEDDDDDDDNDAEDGENYRTSGTSGGRGGRHHGYNQDGCDYYGEVRAS